MTKVRVEGLAELRRALTQLEKIESRNDLRDGLKKAADIVAQDAKGRVPTRSGAAASTISPFVSGTKAGVRGGKGKVKYYGWLDFGSRSPRTGNPRTAGPWKQSGKGPVKGRFIYPAAEAKKQQVEVAVRDAVDRAVRAVSF